MALRRILRIGEPALRSKAREVTRVDGRIKTLLNDMYETMTAAEGFGLAAVQVGVMRRAVVINTGEGRIDLINPRIVSATGGQTGEEGCLSVPEQRGDVERPMIVVVESMDIDGNERTITGEGLLARVICHEIDHLDGIMFVDRIISHEK